MKALQLLLISLMVKFLTSSVPKTNETLFSNLFADISSGIVYLEYIYLIFIISYFKI